MDKKDILVFNDIKLFIDYAEDMEHIVKKHHKIYQNGRKN